MKTDRAERRDFDDMNHKESWRGQAPFPTTILIVAMVWMKTAESHRGTGEGQTEVLESTGGL